jgi:hypothetical protein
LTSYHAVPSARTASCTLLVAGSYLGLDSGQEQVAKLMKDAAELSRELNDRWLEITQRVFALQERLLSRCAAAAAKVQ